MGNAFFNLFKQQSTSNSIQEEDWKDLLDQLRSKTSEECYQNALNLKGIQPDAFGPVLQYLVRYLQENPECPDNIESWISFFRSFVDAQQRTFPVKVFPLITAQTHEADQQILDQLQAQGTLFTPTDDPQQCDVILLFCPILSRIGSDVDAAVKKIPVEGKPVVLVLMHHTFEKNLYLDKTCWREQYPSIKQEVRVLFHKSQNGLLQCPRNQEALQTLQNLFDHFNSTKQSGQSLEPMKDHSVGESSGASAPHSTSSQSQVDPEEKKRSEELHRSESSVVSTPHSTSSEALVEDMITSEKVHQSESSDVVTQHNTQVEGMTSEELHQSAVSPVPEQIAPLSQEPGGSADPPEAVTSSAVAWTGACEDLMNS